MSEQTTQGQETGQECAWCVTGYPTATQARGIVHLLPGGIEVRCYRGAPVFAASPTPRSGGVPREEVEDATDRYERLAAEFYADTHLMAPGKDQSAAEGSTHTYEERRAAYLAWLAGRKRGREESPTPQPQPSGSDEGCLCGKCGRRYRVDVQVPNALWAALAGSTELLCPRCIADGLEALGEFAAFRLTDVDAPAQPSGGVPTSVPTLVEVEKALATVSHFAHFSEAAKRDADAPADWVAQQEQRERAAHKKARTLLQQLHAAAVQGAEDRARWEKLEALMWDAEACGNGLAFMPVARHSLGVTYEPSRIMTVVDLGDEDGSNLSADVAEGDTLIAAVDALLAARQPRPEGQGVSDNGR